MLILMLKCIKSNMYCRNVNSSIREVRKSNQLFHLSLKYILMLTYKLVSLPLLEYEPHRAFRGESQSPLLTKQEMTLSGKR